MEAFSRALVLYQHLAKPQTRTSVVVLTRGHIAFVSFFFFIHIVLLVYESALFKARAHTEMPVLFVLFYFI